MIIIGIDPGYAITGYGIIDYSGNRFRVLDYGTITTRAHVPFEQRLLTIYSEIESVLTRFRPEVMAIEELFFFEKRDYGDRRGSSSWCTHFIGGQSGIPVFEYTPMQVKMAVTGYGRADKNQVSQMVKTILCLERVPKKDDTSDALAIAICQAHSGLISSNKAVSGYQYGRYGKDNVNKYR